MGKSDLVIILIVISSFILNCVALSFMPAKIVTHWDHKGEPEGYMQKTFGLFMLTVIIGMMAVIFIALPKADTIKVYIKSFLSYYYVLTIWFMIMLLFINIHNGS